MCLDFTGDDWPDIFVTNDAMPNRLWVNRHDGTFVDEAVIRGVAVNALGQSPANMGITVGDTNGDGLPDLFVTHLTEEIHSFWTQRPAGIFQDQTASAGLSNPKWHGTGFGDVLSDFRNVGYPDLAVVNGRVKRPPLASSASRVETGAAFWDAYAERNQIFQNDGAGRFTDVSDSAGTFCQSPAVSRGLAWGDIDNDGGIDLLVTSISAPARLYRNEYPERGHWRTIRTVESAGSSRRDAIGAKVTISANGRRQSGYCNPAGSYLCSSDPRVHFGLGPSQRIDSIEIVWPEGSRETFDGSAADRVITLRKGDGN